MTTLVSRAARAATPAAMLCVATLGLCIATLGASTLRAQETPAAQASVASSAAPGAPESATSRVTSPATSFDVTAAPKQPAHYIADIASGVPLRLTRNEELGQDRFAPPFMDVLLGYVLPGRDRWRHGFGAGVSWNLGRDGHYVTPVYAGDQLTLMPAYLAYLDLGPDLMAIGHAGVPILVRGGRSAGLELGALFGYRVLAGAGVFAELDVDGFLGALSSVNLIASLKAGIVIDYEVLP